MNDRLKRINMRANRRGMKENDIILGKFATAQIETLDADHLVLFEQLLEQPDQSIYKWVIGAERAPDAFLEIIGTIREFHCIQ